MKRPVRGQLRGTRTAFSLVELLVTLFVVALLMSLLLPGLSAAREQAAGVMCRSNLHQIMLANRYYAEDYNVYVPGASNVIANLDRWHGRRDQVSEVFDAARGPLAPYIGEDGAVRQCPSFPAEEIAKQSDGFERGCGGYGYNNAFIGVQVKRQPSGEYEITNDRAGAMPTHVQRPAETIQFTDAAFAGAGLIEYSFAEPRFHPSWPNFRPDPSIHFRHRGRTNVGWCDGHVDAAPFAFTTSSGMYETDPKRWKIGWFGDHDDNRLFDLR